MEEILDGSAFAQKFGVGGDLEATVAAAIGSKRALQFETRTRRNGAFLNDQLGRTRLRGDLLGAVINGGKVGTAILTRRSTYADEDGVAEADGFAGVGGVGDSASFRGGGENFVEVLFVNGDLAGFQLRDTRGINIRADDFMAGFREASSGNQTDVAATNDLKVSSDFCGFR